MALCGKWFVFLSSLYGACTKKIGSVGVGNKKEQGASKKIRREQGWKNAREQGTKGENAREQGARTPLAELHCPW